MERSQAWLDLRDRERKIRAQSRDAFSKGEAYARKGDLKIAFLWFSRAQDYAYGAGQCNGELDSIK